MKNTMKYSLLILTIVSLVTNNSYAIFGKKSDNKKTHSTTRNNNPAKRPNRKNKKTKTTRNNQKRSKNSRRIPTNKTRHLPRPNRIRNHNVNPQPNREMEEEEEEEEELTEDQIRNGEEAFRQIQEEEERLAREAREIIRRAELERQNHHQMEEGEEYEEFTDEQIKEQREILRQIDENNRHRRRHSNPNNQTTNNRPRRNSTDEQHQCVICIENKPMQDCCRLSCGHTFCRKCLTTMFNNARNERDTSSLKCPNPDCANPMTEQDVRTITNNNQRQMEAFANVTMQEWIKRQRNAKVCPTEGCNYAFINENGNRQTMRCPQCNNQYCSKCLFPHQARTSCQEAERLRRVNTNNPERASLQWIEKNTKKCPQCNKKIEKNEGCLHMQCTQCKHHFCWECLRPWQTHNNFYECALD